ncbi:uncharacterized protein B0H18DRAFT_1112788 [Fomitopsis serialis]|uniref:uncharacterized protein n=1 Tax=Fomitopsis serialis TaxID=139415 RepID=UPI002008AE50|nr:uncharacterized protein B0H18DRAFT_1112788 [Neoantrodia serialis]KAH9938658.1 hypothetical protein B0H18DRAFT_1112788 [Neoantrodia serialis]
MLNNAHIVRQLARQLQDAEPDPSSSMSALMRGRLHPEPCMLARLPTTDSLKAFIEREAEYLAPKAVIKQLRRSPSPSPPNSDQEDHDEPEEEPVKPRSRAKSLTSMISSLSLPSRKLSVNLKRFSAPQTSIEKPIEPHEVFSAIERKDIAFLMEVRDKAFHLLSRGTATPLPSCTPCAAERLQPPGTRKLLRTLRLNLRAAIDMGLQTQQSDLIASFLQTLVMSEGERWVSQQAASVAAALRIETEDKPVKSAEDAVRGFATKQLGKASMIVTYEDYVANATGDLLLMGAWHGVVEAGVEGELIPTWYFARDERVYRAFVERLDQHQQEIKKHCGKRLRWQLRVLRQVMEGRATSWHQKVVILAEEFDNGEGVL